MPSKDSKDNKVLNSNNKTYIVAAVIAALIAISFFCLGMSMRNDRRHDEMMGFRQGMGDISDFKMQNKHMLATVKTVSDNSISVLDLRNGETKSYNINSNTLIVENGAKTEVTSIKAGQDVRILADNNNNALRISINPASSSQVPANANLN